MSRNQALQELISQHVPRGVATTHPISIVQGEGALVRDAEGREYIDLVGGIGVLNVGHRHPRVMQAARAQIERFTHTCFQVAMYDGYARLAERLNGLVPINGDVKTALFTTGVEAVENAVKIARSFTQRPAILAFTPGFHGRTLLGMSLTGKASPYKQNFGPFAPEVYHASFPYPYRGIDDDAAIASLDDVLATQVAPDQLAAIIVEPVVGEGGFLPASPRFLQHLRAITERFGILLIADEIQTGFARTGKMFAVEHSGIKPDLTTLAKSLAGGFPLSAVVGRADVMDGPAPGGLGGTYGGNPVAIAAALAVLDVIEEEGLVGRSHQLGRLILDRSLAAQRELDLIGEVRGLGAMVAIELVADRQSRIPAPDLADDVLRRAREGGVLVLKAGLYGNVLRILVPLVVSDSQIVEALDVLFGAVRDASIEYAEK